MYKSVNQTLMRIGNNIRIYRHRKNYSQEKLAELLEVSVSTIYRIENGASAMDVLLLLELAEVLGQPIQNLTELSDLQE